ncbi:hypothetical protein H2198_003374 [Neophaeococcomyces mojaviensis]|uniref:Uncharacterized protein n=1 Tax=Neophaeococcomyces mojaviensis TaxID=3383035 RepID=A0ACC3ABL1_9EURO|nr:hypothetical protein H2198_003374 [Knufia sp. JES_112]
MSRNRYSREILGSLGLNHPLRVSSIHTDNTQDSGYATDPGQLLIPATDDAVTVYSRVSNPSIKSKPYQCTICTADKRFTTINDLTRHMKTVHSIFRKGDKVWLCPVKGCASVGKQWPRYDNFRQHVVKQHGHEYDVDLEQAYSIIADDQIGNSSTSSFRANKPRTDAFSASRSQMNRSPLVNLEPQVSPCPSASPSEQDTFSHAVSYQQQSPPTYTIKRHSFSSSTTSTHSRKVHSYVSQPAQSPVVVARADHIYMPKPSDIMSSAVSNPEAEALGTSNHVLDIPPDTIRRVGYPLDTYINQQSFGDGKNLNQDSFLEQYDAHHQSSWTRSPELTAIGSSFANQSDPSLTNTASTMSNDSARTTSEQLGDLQECTISLDVPQIDFQMFSSEPTFLASSRHEPIPQLQISDSPTSLLHHKEFQSNSVCCRLDPRSESRLLLSHRCSQGYSPDTLQSSLSEGEKSFVYYEATHDGGVASIQLTPLASAFVEDVARTTLELYLNKKACSQESTESGGSDQRSTSSRRPTQSSNFSNNARKRGRGDEAQGPSRHPPGGHRRDGDEDDPNPGDGPNSKRTKTSEDEKTLACPFYKNDPLKHPRCAILILRGIPAVKQHLYRVHKRPDHYCVRCSVVFPNQDSLEQHQLAGICTVVANRFAGMMSQDAYNAIKKQRNHGTIDGVWYFIYDTIFPGQPRPRSHLVDDQAAVLHVLNIFMAFGPEAVRTASQNRAMIPAASHFIFDQVVQIFSEHYSAHFGNQSSHTLQAPFTMQQNGGFLTPERVLLPYTAPPTQNHANMTGNQIPQSMQLSLSTYQPNGLHTPETMHSSYSAPPTSNIPNIFTSRFSNMPLFDPSNSNDYPQSSSSPTNNSHVVNFNMATQSAYIQQRQTHTMNTTDALSGWEDFFNADSTQQQFQGVFDGSPP